MIAGERVISGPMETEHTVSFSKDVSNVIPIATLIDELKHDNISVRIAAMRRLPEISSALGPDRTRNELIPYLNEFVEDEDDVLITLAEQLPSLIHYIGGHAYGQVLFAPLETIASVEEPSVRNRAIESVIAIASHFTGEQIVQHLLTLVERLANGEWFTTRAASCPLFPVTYSSLRRLGDPHSERCSKLLQLFSRLCVDETPMVRRTAASNLGKLVPVVEKAVFMEQLFPSFLTLAKEEQDSVRLITVEICVQISDILDNDVESVLLPTILDLCQDQSWRVRYMAADKIVDLCKKMSQGTRDRIIVDCYVSLLKDIEPEVRTVAASKLIGIAELISRPLVVEKLIPVAKELANDQSQYARASLATVAMGLSRLISRDEFFEHLLPMFLLLLRDPVSDVRLNIISRLDFVNDFLGIDVFIQSILPSISGLASDPNWRVRQAIVENIPSIAKQLGLEFFQSQLLATSMSWMCDRVASVRSTATKNLSRFVELFGVEWAVQHLVPHIVEMLSNCRYLCRTTAISGVLELSKLFGSELVTKTLLSQTLQLSKDPVPNVRFSLAKFVGAVAPTMSSSVIQDNLIPILGTLMVDDDVDVRYFADQSMSICKAHLKQDGLMRD